MVTAGIALLWLAACTQAKPITVPFTDDFNSSLLGDDYNNTGGPYEIRDGKLQVQGAYNHPLWLKRKLPRNAEIVFEATSKSTEGG